MRVLGETLIYAFIHNSPVRALQTGNLSFQMVSSKKWNFHMGATTEQSISLKFFFKNLVAMLSNI